MTITAIKRQNAYNGQDSINDIIIHRPNRQAPSNENPCQEFLREGECSAGDCKSCVQFILRAETSAAALPVLKKAIMQASYDMDQIIKLLLRHKDKIEFFVNDEWYDIAQKSQMKQSTYQFLMVQQRNASEKKPAVLSKDVNQKIAKFLFQT